MHLTSLNLTNYRNILSAEFVPAEGVTILHGRNGQGKTNILEAVNAFAQGRPYRTRHEKDLLYGIAGTANGEAVTPDKIAQFTRAEAEFVSGDGKTTHETMVWAADGTKKLTRDDIPARPADFIGRFRTALFSPENLQLVKGGPGQRRAFLDLAISQLDPLYLASLTRYNKALMQRNALLKSWRSLDAASRQSLQSYTPVMAKEAAYITDKRESYVRQMSDIAAKIYSDMTDNAELMKAFYRGRRSEDEFSMLFRDYENRDVDAGMTLIGPQRDDMTVLLDGVPARQMASQGQQRAIVLSLKLAEGEISREISGEYPVFLLDDVLSEIDAPRREYLMGELAEGGRQVIITTCESEIKGDKIYEVEKGEIREREE